MAVEEPADEVKVAGTATPDADCQRARYVRIGSRRKRRYLLVANVNPLDRFLAPDRVGDLVERIADDPIDTLYPCFDQSLDRACGLPLPLAECYKKGQPAGFGRFDALLQVRLGKPRSCEILRRIRSAARAAMPVVRHIK